MKNLPSVLTLLGMFALYAIGSPNPPKSLDSSAAGPSPFCKCDSCECETCNCTPLVDHTPLVVGQPPDLHATTRTDADAQPAITPAEAAQVAQLSSHNQSSPSLIVVSGGPKTPCAFCKSRPCVCVPAENGVGPIPYDAGPHQRHTLKNGEKTLTFYEQEFAMPPQILPVIQQEFPSIIDRHTAQIKQIQNTVDDTGRTNWIPAHRAAASQPVKKETAAAGHWQTVRSCGPNGCSTVQQWVPHHPAKQAAPVVYQQQSYGSCGPGGCGTRRGLFGRRR